MLRNSRRPHLRLHYTYDAFRSCFFTFKTTTFASIEEDNGEAVGCWEEGDLEEGVGMEETRVSVCP